MAHRESDKILSRLLGLHPKIIDLSLDRMKRILSELDHPEKRLPPVIHVAGTNGKGSTIAYLRAILEAAGFNAHVYTSPHLVRFAERIRLNGQIIDEDYLQSLLAHCEEVNAGLPITYFEITTAAAFKAFADTPADILLLEVGLGGRLDATNMVDEPISTVLTPISLDHEQFLGNDLSIIAMEKASIAKKNVPMVSDQPNERVMNKIIEIANLKHASLKIDWGYHKEKGGFLYHDQFGTLRLPSPNLLGPHQMSNAALAIATLRHQDKLTIDNQYYARGITNASWPARMQNITNSKFGRMLPSGSQLWLDGGHNPAAGQVIADTFQGKKITIICGMLENKDIFGYLTALSSVTSQLFGIQIDGEVSHSADKIVEMAKKCAIKAYPTNNIEETLEKLEPQTSHIVLICGSLYLAGQVLRDNNLIPE